MSLGLLPLAGWTATGSDRPIGAGVAAPSSLNGGGRRLVVLRTVFGAETARLQHMLLQPERHHGFAAVGDDHPCCAVRHPLGLPADGLHDGLPGEVSPHGLKRCSSRRPPPGSPSGVCAP